MDGHLQDGIIGFIFIIGGDLLRVYFTVKVKAN